MLRLVVSKDRLKEPGREGRIDVKNNIANKGFSRNRNRG
jgi:hypothetical protein